jgi:DNA ligase-1
MVPAAFKGHSMESMDYSTFGGQDLTGWLVSEKLDGVRGLWDGRALWTRQGNRIAAPAWFTAGLPAWPLDGELYAGPGTLARVAGLVRRESAKGADWGGVRFCLFDAPAAAGGFADRLAQLNDAAILLPGHVGTIAHFECQGAEWLGRYFEAVTARGGEGLVAKRPAGAYKTTGRSNDVMKIKEHPGAPMLLECLAA